ncbi:MAG: tetratricopeptide repeat protein [Pseudomonadota bacterium]
MPAFAAYQPPAPRPDMDLIKAQIDAGEASAAMTPLYDWLVKDRTDAEALNLLGYAYRKLGQWDKARFYYERTLSIKPGHKGALSYMGALELQTGDPNAARVLLIRLQAACPDGCAELDDLLKAFKEHNTSTGG